MYNVNRVELVGNLGSDPELRYTSTNTPVANLSLATNERWTDDKGRHERTEWHRVQCWGSLAEHAAKHLKKGSYVRIVGKLTTRKWEKNGFEQTSTDVKAQELGFLDRAERAAEAPEGPRQEAPAPSGIDDDNPF